MNVCPNTVIPILVNQRRNSRVFEVLVELLHVQTKFARDRLYLAIAQILLVRKQFFMHFPELPLFSCCQSGNGRFPCIAVHREGKVLGHKLHVPRVSLRHLPEEGLKPRAVRSLIIIEDYNGDPRILWPSKRRTGHVNLIQRFKKNNLDGFLCTARNDERVRPR